MQLFNIILGIPPILYVFNSVLYIFMVDNVFLDYGIIYILF